jgi:hypothetical protein
MTVIIRHQRKNLSSLVDFFVASHYEAESHAKPSKAIQSLPKRR